jgi:transcription-repair coupling factor (superfamily II helicase)
MTRDELLGLYRRRGEVVSVANFIEESTPHRLHLRGFAGSSHSLFAAAVSLQCNRSQLFVLGDKEEAAYFQNNLDALLGENASLFFPASYKKTFQLDELDNASVLLRAEVLNRINKSQAPQLVVTYAEALAEKVVTRKNLEQNSIDVRVHEKLSIDFITDFLLMHEFANTDFVAEAGEFSVRGGIVDIWSFANDLPYRVEFFGDEVESLRTFDPATQLSVQAMNHVTIIPNVQTKLLQHSHASFFDFIPKSMAIWMKSPPAPQRGVTVEVDSNIFESDEQILSHIERFTTVEFGSQFHFPIRPSGSGGAAFDFNISPQPSFNKNFDLLIKNLQQNQQKNIKNLILADTAKQVERIYAIFEDLEKKSAANKVEFTSMLLTLHEGFIDHTLGVACYTDHQIFDRYHRFRLKKSYSKSEALTLKELYALKPGDFVTHIDHGIGRYAGLETIKAPPPPKGGIGHRAKTAGGHLSEAEPPFGGQGGSQEMVRLIYKDNDILYVSIHSLHRIAKYTGKEGTAPTLHKLGSTAWSTLKQKTKKKVKDIAKDLIELYAKRRAQKGFAFSPDTYMQTELEASFIYEDTPDQIKSTRDVKGDMEKSYPMDRLVCGDVGFGKTEIAIRAAFKAVADDKQVAVLVPTTILALQHYNTFSERLKDFPVKIDYINRFKSAAKQKETLKNLEEGKIGIIIGTHRLLGKDVKFKDLGLMILDEEQKFGVAAKEKLRALKVNVHTLTLTATPIPRTLQFSLMGARDLSIINTPPPNRYPITTELHTFNEKIIRDAIDFEVARGGQVFFIHNRVSDIHDMANMIHKLSPHVKVSVGHGQMDGPQLEDVMLKFVNGESDVLVSTTIIESGLDIANANTIIINQAQNFGLSDLHQMRGRVGRSNKKAFCYLLTPPMSVLTNEAKQRLKAIEEFSDLGSGFNVAMRDLDIRGAGNLLGGEQSGFISEIGYEMYHKILDEAIAELKETDFSSLFTEELQNKPFVRDCQIDTDLEILFPTEYVNSVSERLLLYKELDGIDDENKLQEFEAKLKDRFGPLPQPALELLSTIRLRWIAEKLGFEKIVLKNQRMVGYFVSNPTSHFYQSEVFSRVLKFVQSNQSRCKMKEDGTKLSLTVQRVKTVDDANEMLKQILGEAQ